MAKTNLMVCVDDQGNITQAQYGKFLMVTPGYTFTFGNVDEEIAKLAINYRIEMDGFTPKLVAKDGVEIPEQPEEPKIPLSTEEEIKQIREETQSMQMAILELMEAIYSRTKK